MIGASQYTTQVSGSTIYVWPMDVIPVRNVPVIAPDMKLDDEEIDPDKVAASIKAVLRRLDLGDGERPVAVFAPWRGSATFARLDAFCRGVVAGMEKVLAHGHPIVLVGDGDVGGLIGIHCREELKLDYPIISIDGLELKEFDYIDIGAILEFLGRRAGGDQVADLPPTAAPGMEWQPAPPDDCGIVGWATSPCRMECTPWSGQEEPVELTPYRACSCSNMTGLLYPSAEWRRLALYTSSMKRGKVAATSSKVS